MNILARTKRKIILWWNFYRIADNFLYIVMCRVITMARLQKLFPYDAIIVLRNGTRIAHGSHLDVSAVPVTVEIWKDKKYSPPGFAIGPADTVVDIGANVGNFALYAATFTQGHVYCIEPMDENIARIKRNITLNGLANVIPVQAAATNIPGKIDIHISSVNATHSLFRPADDTGRTVTVEGINIEAFCAGQGITDIGFMKMDCEGAEYDIILHWSDAFTRSIKQIVLEYHTVPGHGPGEIMDFLKKHNFTVTEYDGQYIAAKQ